jgi:outer membrane lipoprotein-sorting protein
VVLGGCATAAPLPAPPPVSEEARAALARIEQHRLALRDLRSRANITIRRGGRAQRLTGVLLLLSEPATMRFEALSPLGPPVLIVAGDPKSVTLWEVLDNRAYIAPPSPDANRRWLGLALGVEDLVALLAGRVRPMPDPTTVELMAADAVGPSLRLTGAPGEQRIWFDPDSGQVRQVEWTGKNPARVTFTPAPADGPPAGFMLETADASLRVSVAYVEPRMNTSFDPALLTLTVPQDVRIQDFR